MTITMSVCNECHEEWEENGEINCPACDSDDVYDYDTDDEE